MRILSIKLKNINSLRGEWEIDFTKSPLKDAGLFAMIGATGSGKSTILDCISLAIYNQVPRLTKISKDSIEKGGLILTKNERDCFTEVKYSCRSGVFTSRWSISKTRKGETFREYEMQVFDEQGLPLTERKSEVPGKNSSLIGLDYDQFSKSILLSQGEFAKFLKSTKTERSQLLEEITGTRDFRRLGRMAYYVYGQKKKLIENKLELIKSQQALLISEEEEKELELQIGKLEIGLTVITEEREKIKARIDLRNRLILLQQGIDKKKEKAAVLKQEAENFERQHAETLKHYTELLPYKEDVHEYVKKHDELILVKQEIERNLAKEKELSKRIIQFIAELSLLIKKDIKEDDFFEQLDAFREEVIEKISRKQQLMSDAASALVRIKNALKQPFLSEENKLFDTPGTKAVLLKKLQSRLEDSEYLFRKHMEGHALKEENLQALRIELQETISDLGFLQTDVRGFLQNNIRIRENEGKMETLGSELKVLVEKVESMQAETVALESSFAKAEEERRKMLTEQGLEAYRNQLVEGEPCPLCGSEAHPYVHEYAKDLSKVDDQYNKVKAALNLKKQDLQNLSMSKLKCEENLKGIATLVDRDKSDNVAYTQKIDSWKKKLAIEKIGSEDTAKGYIIVHQEKLVAVEFCLSHLVTKPVLLLLIDELEHYSRNQANAIALDNEIGQLYRGTDIHRDYKLKRDRMQSSVNERKQVQLAISKAQAQSHELQSSLNDLTTSLLTGLQALGHVSIMEANEKIINEEIFYELNAKRNTLKSEQQTGERVLLEDQERLKTESVADDAAVKMENLQRLQQEILVTWNEQNKQLEDERLKWRSQYQTRKQIGRIEEEVRKNRQANLPWELLCNHIGDKNGNKFNNFAQMLTLKHLLNFANRRLQKLHNRYHLSMPGDEEEDDLVVIDNHMGNERRSVKTLSGGETFIISLSLALGLSDLASRDIKIESLFVDEGFGTLDPETLEEAIDTLEQLQADSSKMVGIISHVDSLKERIYTQIQLEKQQNGFSTIRLYPEEK